MNKPVSTVPTPPSPSPSPGTTTRDSAANPCFLSGEAARQTATCAPHGSEQSGYVPTHARRKPALEPDASDLLREVKSA